MPSPFLLVDQVGTQNGMSAVSDTNPLPQNRTSEYPIGATPLIAASGNVAANSAVATLAGVAGKTTYITGFSVTGAGATVGLVVGVTVTGLIGGVTATYNLAAVAGALLSNAPLMIQFIKPIPASATNTSIVVTVPSLGLGNTNSSVVAHGYQQ